MNNKQVWQTIALDLKRAANLFYNRKEKQARFFLNEAKQRYYTRDKRERQRMTKNYICFKTSPEDLLLASSIISARL